MKIPLFLRKLTWLSSSPPSRERYPKELFMDWEFIPREKGFITARLYGPEGLREETFQTQKQANIWVNTHSEFFRKKGV